LKAFVDTNIVVYANSDDLKSRRAQAVLELAQVISVQILNEFANVARRRLGKSIDQIAAVSQMLRQIFEVRAVTIELHDAALGICDRYGFQFYDSLIVATALEAGCNTLYSEDLRHQQLIDKRLRIINPFV
jgi:predicted nucleic acid-binding protein